MSTADQNQPPPAHNRAHGVSAGRRVPPLFVRRERMASATFLPNASAVHRFGREFA